MSFIVRSYNWKESMCISPIIQKQDSCLVEEGHSGIEAGFDFPVKLVPVWCGRSAWRELYRDKDSLPHTKKIVGSNLTALGMKIHFCDAQYSWFDFSVKLVPVRCGRSAWRELHPDKDSLPHTKKIVGDAQYSWFHHIELKLYQARTETD